MRVQYLLKLPIGFVPYRRVFINHAESTVVALVGQHVDAFAGGPLADLGTQRPRDQHLETPVGGDVVFQLAIAAAVKKEKAGDERGQGECRQPANAFPWARLGYFAVGYFAVGYFAVGYFAESHVGAPRMMNCGFGDRLQKQCPSEAPGASRPRTAKLARN